MFSGHSAELKCQEYTQLAGEVALTGGERNIVGEGLSACIGKCSPCGSSVRDYWSSRHLTRPQRRRNNVAAEPGAAQRQVYFVGAGSPNFPSGDRFLRIIRFLGPKSLGHQSATTQCSKRCKETVAAYAAAIHAHARATLMRSSKTRSPDAAHQIHELGGKVNMGMLLDPPAQSTAAYFTPWQKLQKVSGLSSTFTCGRRWSHPSPHDSLVCGSSYGKRHLRALPQNRAQRVLPCRLPQEGVSFDRRAAD